jgi:CHAD domain-containing protein
MSAGEATKTILTNLFDTMKRNETGIINDIDTEFLHDYRVAIRRIRSVFGQLKNVYKQEIYSKAKNDFSQLGRRTNRLRDIDVYLLRKTEYQDMLPVDLKKDINSFFTTMVNERKVELKKLRQDLKSEEYRNTMSHWEKFIKEALADVHLGIESDKPVLPFAKSTIWKRYKKVLKFGACITPSSPDVFLHQLRIECKKLRYLLEFFSSLFEKEEINYLIKQLKILQDNLGDLNDLSIQQDTLRRYVETDSNKRTMLALGILIGKLNARQLKIRDNFSNSFAKFADQTTHSLFSKLFTAKAERAK